MSNATHPLVARRRKAMAGQLRYTCGCLLPFLAAAGTATWLYAVFTFRAPTFSNVAALIISSALLAMFTWWFFDGLKDRHRASVFPYFERKLGDIDTFRRGRTLVERFAEVDHLAVALALAPLHTFGFNDDLAGEPLNWHDPGAGLATIKGLLEHLRAHADVIPDQPEIIEDLERIKTALEKAKERHVRFCLLLNVGTGYTAQEHLVRKGSVL